MSRLQLDNTDGIHISLASGKVEVRVGGQRMELSPDLARRLAERLGLFMDDQQGI